MLFHCGVAAVVIARGPEHLPRTETLTVFLGDIILGHNHGYAIGQHRVSVCPRWTTKGISVKDPRLVTTTRSSD